MHEASLTRDLMRRIAAIAADEDGGRVVKVSVWLGALSHMSEAHFREHFELAAAGTPAEGAALAVTVSDSRDDPNAQAIILESVEIES